jgi:putative heme-binding domain-containing protein
MAAALARRPRGEGRAEAEAALAPVIQRARATVLRTDDSEDLRLSAIEVLPLASGDVAAGWLTELLDPQQPVSVQLAAVRALENVESDRTTSLIVERFKPLPGRVRQAAMLFLSKAPSHASDLLSAVEKGTLTPSDVGPLTTNQLEHHRDPGVRDRALRVFSSRPAAVAAAANGEKLAEATRLRGDVERGRVLFEQRCAACHRASGSGHALGPDVAASATRARDVLLTDILEPSREVAVQYVPFEVEGRDGKTAVGILEADTSFHVTLKHAFGVETVIPRQDIRKMRALGSSLMPDGLVDDLPPRSVADLLEFIQGSAAGPTVGSQ